MGQPAARMTDLAGHGGPIVFGDPTVLIGGLPAARVGDPFTCPGFDGPKPHVAGNIIMGSMTVLIGGSFAARMGDPTGCGTVGVVGQGMPAVIGPSTGPDVVYTGAVAGVIGDESGTLIGVEGEGENSAAFLWGQVKGYENTIDFGTGRGEAEGALAHASGQIETPIGEFDGSVDVGHLAASGHAGSEGVGGAAEATLVKGKVAWQTSQENPVYVGAEGEGKLMTAEAKGDILLGSDGRRTGIYVEGGAEAAAAKGEIAGETGIKEIPIPFTDYSFNLGVKGKVGGTLAGVGAGGYAGIYHDAEDGKVHATIGGKLAAAIGLKFDLDIMLEIVPDKPKVPPNGVGIPMTPGVVIGGYPTVLIG